MQYERIFVKIVVYEAGGSNFRENGASIINDYWHQKSRVPGL